MADLKHESVDTILPYLPTTGWLAQYMRFTDNLEICPRFRFFTAACALGAAINNKCWIQRGDPGLLPRLFPNIWIIILAPPGRGHKTTAINMSVNALIQACEEVRILADKLTPEYLIKALSAPASKKEIIRIGPRDATGLIKAPELSVFFGKQQYNVGLINLITDLYDYREVWKGGTIGRGSEELHNNCISICGGSTPSWLQHMLPEDAFTGGFMSRFVVVEMPPTYYKRVTHPRKPKDMEWKDIVLKLKTISNVKFEFIWGKGSLEAYDKVYDESRPTGDPQHDAYYERESEQTLKLAMILAISTGKKELTDTLITQAKDILKVLRIETEPRIERVTTHPRMQLTQDIVDQLLLAKGPLTEGELLNRVYRLLSQGERQFYEALSVLHKTGRIYHTGKPSDYSYGLVAKPEGG